MIGDYTGCFFVVFCLWFLVATFFDIVMGFVGQFVNVVAAKVHEGKGDAYVNSAMFLSMEDEG